ncbi:MAG TPA: AMP-binding protein [Propionibacteriaceae bacterium]|nr:AMP-binding protein [Propionibacteriaceae bacterium]
MSTAATSTVFSPTALLQRVDHLVSELLTHDGWSRDRLLAYQAVRLRAVLEHAVGRSRYYRNTLGADAADRPLTDLPTLSKADLMDNFDGIVTDPRLRRTELEAHLASPDPARSYLGAYRVLTTSGTTRRRGIFALTEDEAAIWIAGSMRSGIRAGFRPQSRMIGIGTPSPSHLTRQLFAPLRAAQAQGAQIRGVPAPPEVSAATPLPELVAVLNAYQPDVLLGYPSVAGPLAEEQLAGRLRIPLKGAAFGAEPLTPNLRSRIRAAWGFEPVSIYAATESPIIASSTPEHPELEIDEDLVVVEVVDEHNDPVPPGTPGAKVLITNLVNFAQPLIRYEISDAVTLAAGDNPTGRPYRRIAAIDGRTVEILHLPARNGGLAAVHPSVLGAAFTSSPEVHQYQFVFDGRVLQARVVLDPDAPAELPDRLRRSLEGAIEATGALPPSVDIRPVTELQREPGPGQKIMLVKIVGDAQSGTDCP